MQGAAFEIQRIVLSIILMRMRGDPCEQIETCLYWQYSSIGLVVLEQNRGDII